MNKIIVSPGFGAGWSTWNPHDGMTLLTWPPLIEAIERGDKPVEWDNHFAVQTLRIHLGIKPLDLVTSGLKKAEVIEIPDGTWFLIHEYDGNETVQYLSEMPFVQFKAGQLTDEA